MTDSRPFAHLHCHTHYSLLDGASRIPDLVAKAKASGMNALAVTDHGNLYGAPEFYNVCHKEGVNPIVGYEAYIAPGHRKDRKSVRMKDASFHLTLLAMNREGFRNLIRMASSAYLEGFYYRPRIDKELLADHNEGLICLSGCPSSELSHLLLQGKMNEAAELIAWYEKVFGDRFYLEVQSCGLEIQEACKEPTLDLAKQMGLPTVATNDAHYLNRDDAAAHDVLLCVNTRSVRSDAKRMRIQGDEFYVKTPDEMYEAFADCPDAVARTQEVADRVHIDLDLNTRHFPVFSPPHGKSDTQYLRELCEERLPSRYGDEITENIRDRLEYELGVIEQMGYSSYFLIVWDFVRFADENGIPCGARGSACGALVAYLLGLSDVCPLQYGLLFERFLDPSRAEPPDIDIDFCRDKRQLVIDYTKEKYGKDNVAQIGTFGTLKARAAIRDVGRALGVPLARVDQISKMVPDTLNIKLRDALKDTPELKEIYDTDPEIKELFDIAIRLEGLARSAGTHAAGVVVADRPLSEYVPLQTISGKEDVVTQWDGPHVEQAGLLKMDFLGLRNLTILDKAVRNVKKHRGIDIDPVQLPLDDPETYALLQRGETKGIFQLESGGMRDLLTKMKPDTFNDIIATSALYRPGPLEGGMVMDYVEIKHGRQPVPQVHPIVDAVLEETHGVMVYQEQVMQILNRVGGIELSSAYRCIKAISKKKLPMIAKYREQFITGAGERNLEEAKAVEMFEMIEKFAGYGFNKSHSTAYGAIAYQTAYLKAHFPQEFMAALLSCGMESSERICEHIDDCRRQGIELSPPNVNRSDVEFSVDGEHLAFGLGAIKGVGEQALAAIVREREENGPFKSIFDLTERVDPKQLTRGTLEILIKAGALDSLGPNREQHILAVDRAVQVAAARHRDRMLGQKSLFGEPETDAESDSAVDVVLPDAPDWSHGQKLTCEKEVLGFYLTSHPLKEYASQIEKHASLTAADLVNVEEGSDVLIGGMISAIAKKSTKKPSRNGHTKYVNFDLEDETGVVRCIMWPEEYVRLGEKVDAESVCFVKGRVDRRGREPNLVVNDILTIGEADQQLTRQLAIKFQQGLHSEQDMVRVRDLLRRYPGKTEVVLIVDGVDPEREKGRIRYVLSPANEFRVSCSQEMVTELKEAVGLDFFELHGAARKANGRTTQRATRGQLVGAAN